MRYPPLKFEWVADTPLSRSYVSSGHASIVSAVTEAHRDDASTDTRASDAVVELNSADSLYSVTQACPRPSRQLRPAATASRPAVKASVAVDVIRPVKGRFMYSGFTPAVTGVMEVLDDAGLQGFVDDRYTAEDFDEHGEFIGDGYDDGAGVSASDLVSDSGAMKLLEASARSRLMKLSNEKRHDRVTRSKKQHQ